MKKETQLLSNKEEELYQVSAYLDCVLENSRDMIFRTDLDGVPISFGKGGEAVLGYTRGELSGRKMKDLAVDPGEFDKLAAQCMKQGRAIYDEFSFQHKTGRYVYCRMVLTPLTNSHEEIIGMVGVCRDVTSWRKFREDLIRVDRLAEVGRIASGIVHELNNPVAVIGEIAGWIGAVASDSKGLGQEDQKEIKTSVRHISEQTKRCRDITHQLLSFVRDSKLSTTSLDAHELLKESVSLLTPELKFTDVEIVFDFMEGPVVINSDKRLLEQVFVNFISNAVYAVKEKPGKGGRITLKTSLCDVGGVSMVEINISDTGIGISEEDQKKIYEYFYTTKPSGKGTGLGLPISRNIIQKLGGSISFESQLGKGTTFAVKLPVS